MTEAAGLEGIRYKAFLNKTLRHPELFTFKYVSRPEGGRPLKLVSVTSLSPAAQEKWRREQVAPAIESIIEDKTAGEPKWYETIDRSSFRQLHAEEFAEKVELVHRLRACMETPWGERRAAHTALAAELGTTERTIQNYISEIVDADYRAQKHQREQKSETSLSIEYQAMSLCRKPRDKNTFPRLTDEMRTLAENIYSDRELARNHPTRELMANKFLELARKRGIQNLPSKHVIKRYMKYLESVPEYRDAHSLAVLGRREYENRRGLKTRRDTTALKVMEVVMGDAHTLDFWARSRDRMGRERAVRPVLVAWIDVKTRRFMGARLCVTGNYDVLKESFFKMVYQEAYSVPRWVYIDNGKDYTAKAMTGQTKKERRNHAGEADSAVNGYYMQLGVQGINVALPYHPYSKGQIERSFGTLIENFSKLFTSYVGTLTGSNTSDKVPKDIKRMFEEGKLLSIEEVQNKLDDYIAQYNLTENRALRDAGEAWTKPIELFEKGERYECAPPPMQYAIELMKQDDVALVRTTGIVKFKRRYMNSALAPYIGDKVNVKYDPDDKSKLWVYDQKDGTLICVAEEAQDIGFMDYADQETLAEHRRMQNQQVKKASETLRRLQSPYETRSRDNEPQRRTQSLDGLMYESRETPATEKAVQLPQDREWRAGVEQRQEERKRNKWVFENDNKGLFDYLDSLEEYGEAR